MAIQISRIMIYSYYANIGRDVDALTQQYLSPEALKISAWRLKAIKVVGVKAYFAWVAYYARELTWPWHRRSQTQDISLPY
jgi:hypothetical protein